MASVTLSVEVFLAEMPLQGAAAALYVAGLVSFAVSFVWVSGDGVVTRHPRIVAALIVWQALLATFANTDLAYIVSMLLPFVYPWRRALWWLIGWTVPSLVLLTYFILEVRSPQTATPRVVAIELLVHIVWRAAMFAVGLTVATERDARARLAQTNQELVAAHALVADRTRLAERLEISRELHDSIGHHIAALSVQLELARHQATGAAREAITAAQASARQLLAEVRGVVSAWRDDSLDLRQALEALVRAIDQPAIELAMGDIECGPEATRTLYRCAQELVTNAVRHAGAQRVWIDLATRDDGIVLVVRDDGRAPHPVVPGNGLRGLAERVEALRGTLAIQASAGASVSVTVWIPHDVRRTA